MKWSSLRRIMSVMAFLLLSATSLSGGVAGQAPRTALWRTPARLSDAEGSISGYVYASDGVTPIAEGIVSAYLIDGDIGEHAFCGGDGAYSVERLPPGDYIVEVWGDGEHLSAYYDGALDRDDATPVTVADGQDTPGIDFTLALGGKISGHIYEPDGTTPISGLGIEANSVDGSSRGYATTGSDGSYCLSPLRSGSYRINSGWSSNYPTVYYDGVTDRDDATPVDVTVGQQARGIDLVMPTTGRISGHVYEPDGETPIAELTVYASSITYGPGGSIRTQADGSYSIGGLLPGEYRVRTYSTDAYPAQYYDGVWLEDDATPVVVVGNETTSDIDFTMAQGGTVRGHVYDLDGITPIESAEVHVGYGPYYWEGTEYTTEEGAYEVKGLPPGEFFVYAYGGSQYPTVYYDGVTDYHSATLVTVELGGIVHGIDFCMVEPGSVAGFVYQPDGVTPLEGVSVSGKNLVNGQGKYATTGPDGSYLIEGLTPGEHRIGTDGGEAYPDMYYGGNTWRDNAAPVTVVAGQVISDINLVVLDGGTISGHIYEPDGVTPAADLYVEKCWFPNDTSCWCGGGLVTTDADGWYEITTLAPYEYIVYVRPDGYPRTYYGGAGSRNEATRIAVTPGSRTNGIDINIVEGGSISGRIWQADGVTPADAVTVAAWEADSGYLGLGARSDTDGTYLLEWLHPGNYHIQVLESKHGNAAEYFKPTPATGQRGVVTVTVGQETTGIDIVLDPLQQAWIPLAQD